MQRLIPKRLSTPRFIESRGTLFLLLFLALSALVLSTWQGVSFFLGKQERNRLLQNAINNGLYNLQQRAAGELAVDTTALHVAVRAPSLRRHLSAEGQSIDPELRQWLDAMLQSSDTLRRFSFVAVNGRDAFHIEKQANSSRLLDALAPASGAEDDYFGRAVRQTMRLDIGENYVSDLHLERDGSTWTPVIHVGTPAVDDANRVVGVAIITIDASGIIDNYRMTDAAARVEVNLVNADGYWLYGKSDEYLWGFAFGHDATMAEEMPEVWRNVSTPESRIFKVDNNSWSSHALTVAKIFPSGLRYREPDKVLWYAVVRNPPEPILSGPMSYIPPLTILTALLAFSWVWTRTITERRRAERELMRAEKLSSLGGLVAGVSHELNTPIGSAVTLASTLHDKAADLQSTMRQGSVHKSDIAEFVRDAKEAAALILRGLNRATELIGHFKQIAVDQGGEHRRSFALDIYIQEMSVTFHHLFRHRQVDLELDLRSGAMMDTYPGPLSQVVINLVQNALVHGFDRDESGLIRISTRNKDDDTVQISVTDTGRGIPADIIDRVFEPFFTTKMGQGGSGLGLHIVYNLVTDILDGKIEVVSHTRRRVTRFTVVIPRISREGITPSAVTHANRGPVHTGETAG